MRGRNNRYDDEFKDNAVRMVIEKERSVTEVAQDLGVSQPTLRRWVLAVTNPEDAGTTRLAELEAENKKLKKQLENANDTVEVLKKSVAIFIKPQN